MRSPSVSAIRTLTLPMLAGALLVAATAARAADVAAPDDATLRRIEQLERLVTDQQHRLDEQSKQITRFEQQRESSWLNERRIEEISALVHEVLQDADTRASLAEGGAVAGWDNGFFLASEDGSFLLRVLGQIQTRYTYNSADNAFDNSTSEDLDDDRGGFEDTRVRLGFKGHVFSPKWQYFIWSGYNWDGSSLLLDAYIRHDLGDGLSLTAGQFKTPLLKEWLVSETRQQFVERSILAGCLCGHYTQGVLATYETDHLRLYGSINDGLVGINSKWSSENVEAFGVTGRAEWLAYGSWGEYNDFNSFPDSEKLLVVGGGAHYQQGEYGTTDDEAQILRWTVDGSLELGGANVFAAVVGNHLSESETIGNLDQILFLVQSGVFVLENTELIARFEGGDLDLPDHDDLAVFTIGVNQFFHGHAVKFTTDLSYSFNALQRVNLGGETFGPALEFHGYRPQEADADGQFVFRAQLQLLF